MSEAASMREMPRYQSHKKVWALKIAAIEYHPVAPNTTERSATITPAEEGYGRFDVSAAYVTKHDPQVGGYYVVYDDGYKSWSPAEAFEAGYTRIK